MKALWEQPKASFDGYFWKLDGETMEPKPVQKPHPPVLLGGMARNVFRRIIEWGDGWIPNRVTPDEVAVGRAKLDELATVAGRDPASIPISVFGQQPDPDLIKRFFDAGAERVTVRLPVLEEKESLVELERMAAKVL